MTSYDRALWALRTWLDSCPASGTSQSGWLPPDCGLLLWRAVRALDHARRGRARPTPAASLNWASRIISPPPA